jgi:hypothetical protein
MCAEPIHRWGGCVASWGCFCDLGNGTIKNTGTGRQWKNKTNTAALHNVNNRYLWAGCCPPRRYAPPEQHGERCR